MVERHGGHDFAAHPIPVRRGKDLLCGHIGLERHAAHGFFPSLQPRWPRAGRRFPGLSQENYIDAVYELWPRLGSRSASAGSGHARPRLLRIRHIHAGGMVDGVPEFLQRPILFHAGKHFLRPFPPGGGHYRPLDFVLIENFLEGFLARASAFMLLPIFSASMPRKASGSSDSMQI